VVGGNCGADAGRLRRFVPWGDKLLLSSTAAANLS
jgi:hypothetical protein